ncbi:unnamed protein product [Rangifer tarandus platyrhynchus]|uniref:Uncharacterized protein n=1 Tax=Rangifer tarandus platyrhynchus TaxID=3082113 RepID=A0AC59YXL3_RANTA
MEYMLKQEVYHRLCGRLPPDSVPFTLHKLPSDSAVRGDSKPLPLLGTPHMQFNSNKAENNPMALLHSQRPSQHSDFYQPTAGQAPPTCPGRRSLQVMVRTCVFNSFFFFWPCGVACRILVP